MTKKYSVFDVLQKSVNTTGLYKLSCYKNRNNVILHSIEGYAKKVKDVDITSLLTCLFIRLSFVYDLAWNSIVNFWLDN